MYILFPISIMYYFGTNLDERFSVKGFWPEPGQTHKIPFERDEINAELDRLKRRRLILREKRLQEEAQAQVHGEAQGDAQPQTMMAPAIDKANERMETAPSAERTEGGSWSELFPRWK